MITDNDLSPPYRTRPLRRAEYHQLVEMGVFVDERIELLAGELVEMSPQGAAHAEVIGRLNEILVLAFSGYARVQVQTPVAATEESEPEPDFAIIAKGDYSQALPEHAYLVIEVAVSSLRKDAGIKSRIYAAAAIPAYWVVDVSSRQVLVHTDPRDGCYQSITTLQESETLTLAQFPHIAIAIAALLPTA